jgi:hypothetical protein
LEAEEIMQQRGKLEILRLRRASQVGARRKPQESMGVLADSEATGPQSYNCKELNSTS